MSGAARRPFIAGSLPKGYRKPMFRRAWLCLLLALLAFGTPAPAQDRPPAPYGNPPAPYGTPSAPYGNRPAPYGYNVQPLGRILPGIRNNRPGRFFDAEGPVPDSAGGWHYRIKWLTPEGRVVWLDADARTGRVIGPYSGFHPGSVMPPSGLRYYGVPVPAPAPGVRGPFGWRPGGWRPGGWRAGGGRPGGWRPGGGRPGGWGPGGGHHR